MAHTREGTKLYQTIPFPGYEGAGHVRGDCRERWGEIRKYLPSDLSAATFLDYGCAEGYFMFIALQEGAKRVFFIDHDKDCLEFAESLATEHGFKSRSEFGTALPPSAVTFGIYLDVHYNGKTPTLKEFSEKCEVLFISPSGEGNINSTKLHKELNEHFTFVDPIYNGYMNRTIFRCFNTKENK